MCSKNLIITCLLTCFLSWSDEYKLTVDKTLRDGIPLAKTERTTVLIKEINQNATETLIFMNIDVTNEVYVRNPKISIFFANDNHNVLKVSFDKKTEIIFYEFPYKIKRELTTESKPNEFRLSDSSHKLSYNFTKSWMPVNASKINAALEFPDGAIYNSYGIRNYKISIDDLMILEEYKKLRL